MRLLRVLIATVVVGSLLVPASVATACTPFEPIAGKPEYKPPPPKCPKPPPDEPGPQAVVAVIDTGINPYSNAFHDDSWLAYRHPSRYIPGYPTEAMPLRLSLDLPYAEAIKKDEKVWETVQRGKLYWIPARRSLVPSR